MLAKVPTVQYMPRRWGAAVFNPGCIPDFWGPEGLFPAPGDGAGSDPAQLYPGIRLLGQSWEVTPGAPSFPWMQQKREEFLLGLWQPDLLKGNSNSL